MRATDGTAVPDPGTVFLVAAGVPRPMAQCAVCGRKVEATDAQPEEGYGGEDSPSAQTVHDGERYLFCSEEHRADFEEHPEEYVEG